MSISPVSLRLGPLSAAVPGALYQQIVDAVKREVGAGRLAPGSALPSFRALAEELLVSVITVKRAYEELEREGIIYRRQGSGHLSPSSVTTNSCRTPDRRRAGHFTSHQRRPGSRHVRSRVATGVPGRPEAATEP